MNRNLALLRKLIHVGYTQIFSQTVTNLTQIGIRHSASIKVFGSARTVTLFLSYPILILKKLFEG
jgi:hypothetical protein